jgi:ATP-binding protein involved in chromosome partitioning
MLPEFALKKFPMLSLGDVSRIVAVASGKGGVGKTTIAVNLALALAQSGAQVGLFDADLYGPNVPLMLGVRRYKPSQGDIPVYRDGTKPYIHPLERFGLKVMSIGLVVGNEETVMPDPQVEGQIIRQTFQDVLWGKLDYLLIDFPPGIGEPQTTLLKTIRLDGVVLVTTPQDLSLMDTSRSLGFYREESVPILGVVENMSYLNCPHCGQPIEVFYRSRSKWTIEGRDIEILGRVPLDIQISRSIDARHPFMVDPEKPDGKAVFLQIAERITSKLRKGPAK